MQVYQDKLTVDNINSFTKLRLVLREILNNINSGGSGGYTPPANGIPKSDLESDVQTTLNNADTDHTSLGTLNTWVNDTLKNWMSGIETIIGGEDDLDDVIDTYTEIKNFLDGISDESTLQGIISGLAAKDATYSNYDTNSYGVMSNSVRKIKTLSLNEFDALVSLDPNTEYNIIES